MKKLSIKICDWCGCKIDTEFFLKNGLKTTGKKPAICYGCFQNFDSIDKNELIKRMYKKDKIFEIMKAGFIAQYLENIKYAN